MVHTPPELFGSRAESEGKFDEVWLPMVGDRGWAVIGTDLKIFERDHELLAYRQAKINVFLLPGQSKVAARVELINACLADMCTACSSQRVDVWRMTMHGIEPYAIPLARPRRPSR